jgi:hypothetical protein
MLVFFVWGEKLGWMVYGVMSIQGRSGCFVVVG